MKKKTQKKKQIKNKGGRPTKYKEEYCDKLIAFFNREKERKVLVKKGVKKLGTKDEYKYMANDLPFFEDFANEINVGTSSLDRWCQKYPKFREAYKKAKGLQKVFLIQNALKGYYNSTFAIFTAKNITDMRDVSEVEQKGGITHTVQLNDKQFEQLIRRRGKKLNSNESK